MRKQNENTKKIHSSFKRSRSIENVASVQQTARNLWRSVSLTNIVNYSGMGSNCLVLSSRNSNDSINDGMESKNTNVSAFSDMTKTLEKKESSSNRNSIVTIVLVEAKDLPPAPDDGVIHNLYCKFRLGSECYKSKAVPSNVQPEWRERFTLRQHKDNFLKISVWDKGKQKNFMGSCILDLSFLERERTHEIWHNLDDGYGQIHFSITICLASLNNSSLNHNLINLENVKETRYTTLLHDLRSSWHLVGSLRINIFGAKGLDGKSNAYCILELDNERVQTPKSGATFEPTWNRCYEFSVYDVTSTLDIKVYGRSLSSALLNEPIGEVSIPLLMISNGDKRWYALKERNKRFMAKGNCPRLRLQMTLIWNPIKASLKLFRPKQVKYVKVSKKHNVPLMYSNVEFIGKLIKFLYEINEDFKRLFEWDDPQTSFAALICWLVFSFYFRLWMLPLILLLPFIYHWFYFRYQDNKNHVVRTNTTYSHGSGKSSSKEGKSLTGKLQDLQHTMIVITNGIEYIASVAERLLNLVSFKVPFLSYLTMIILTICSLLFYFIPINYLLMALAIYKYTRKYLNPDRVLNNDLIDFISRIPDNEVLKDWKELSVPEPLHKQSSGKLARFISTEETESTLTY